MSLLPTKKSVPATGITAFNYLIHSIPKGGKTTLASFFPKVLFLDTQKGTKTMAVDTVDIPALITDKRDAWMVVKEVAGELATDEARAKWSTVVIDVANELYEMVCAHICTEKKVTHIGDISHGKGWDEAGRAFRNFLDFLNDCGYCVIVNCHSKQITDQSGTIEVEKMVPDMPGRMKQTLCGWADVILYISIKAIEVEGDEKGEKSKDPKEPQFIYERVAIASPRPGVEAGGRLALPDEIVLSPDPEEGYHRLEAAINAAATRRLASLRQAPTPPKKGRR